MNIQQLRDKGFEVLTKYEAMKISYASTKAHLDDLKKRDGTVLSDIAKELGLTFKSGAERDRFCEGTQQYKDYLADLAKTNEAYLLLEHDKTGMQMMMDFLRGVLACERELYNRS